MEKPRSSDENREPGTVHIIPDIEDTESILNDPVFKDGDLESEQNESFNDNNDTEPLFNFANSSEESLTPPLETNSEQATSPSEIDMTKPIFELGNNAPAEVVPSPEPSPSKLEDNESLFSDLELVPEVELPVKESGLAANPVAHLIQEEVDTPPDEKRTESPIPQEAADALREIAKFKDLMGDDDVPPTSAPSETKSSPKAPLQPTTTEFSLSLEEEVEPQAPVETPKSESVDLTLAPEDPVTSAPRVKPSAQKPTPSEKPGKPPVTQKQKVAPPTQTTKEATPPLAAEIPVSEILLAEETNTEKKSSRSRVGLKRLVSKLHLDIAVPAILGCLVLGFANYFYFSGDKAPSWNSSFDEAIQSANEKAASAVKAPKGPQATIVEGTTTTPTVHIKSSFTVTNDRISGYLIEITTPQPPAQTPEEIVNGVIQNPWLRKVEVRDLKLKVAEDGSLTAEGPVRTFVEYKNERLRVVSKATVTGTFNKDTKAISIKVSVSTGYDNSPEGLGAGIEAVAGGRFKLYVVAETEATALAPPVQ
jgi:hypothetical protein